MCVDYRKLNRKLIPDRFPLPRIEDIFDNLGRAKFFSVMDLQAGFHQIPLSTESRIYTAFSTDKLLAVEKYPRPYDKDAVRRFVAFANYYRRFVENFAKITKPLTALTKKCVDFEWTETCENAFQFLKQKLLTTPILKYPDFSRQFKIIVDTSDFACGGILTQNYDGMDMPITYISRSFNKGEKNKPPIEKQLLAVHFAIMQLRPYIYGRRFIVKSDHKPLIYLYNLKNPSSRLSRIRLDLEEYDFEIQYVRGRDNVIADALSRITIGELKELSKEAPILAITRSMTQRNSISTNHSNLDKLQRTKLKIFEDFDVGYLKKVPKLLTRSISLNKITKSVCGSTLAAYGGHRKIFELRLANDAVSLKTLFENLQQAANQHGVSKLQMSIRDSLFSIFALNDFKSGGNSELTTLEISLIKPPKVLTDNSEKLKIIKQFHEDKLYEGHMGQKKMYAKNSRALLLEENDQRRSQFCQELRELLNEQTKAM